MGRMKEIFMEIQEKFDGNIPDNFDFDSLIAQKLSEKELKGTSKCCSADMNGLVSEDGPTFEELGICPNCNDHCSVN